MGQTEQKLNLPEIRDFETGQLEFKRKNKSFKDLLEQEIMPTMNSVVASLMSFKFKQHSAIIPAGVVD